MTKEQAQVLANMASGAWHVLDKAGGNEAQKKALEEATAALRKDYGLEAK